MRACWVRYLYGVTMSFGLARMCPWIQIRCTRISKGITIRWKRLPGVAMFNGKTALVFGFQPIFCFKSRKRKTLAPLPLSSLEGQFMFCSTYIVFNPINHNFFISPSPSHRNWSHSCANLRSTQDVVLSARIASLNFSHFQSPSISTDNDMKIQ